MKTKVIVNPNSAKGETGRRWREIEEKLDRAIGRLDVEMTTGREAATDLTRKALKEGFERVIAVGGDGTLNEVVNGFFERDRSINSEATLSVLMSGTGGDFKRTLGLSSDIDEAIKALAQGSVCEIDVGRLTFIGHDGRERTRYFDNIASFGMGGEVDKRVNEMSAPNILGGSASFLLASLRTLISYDNKSVRIVVDDSFDETLKIRLVVVANGQFGGGGMWLAPRARLDDGLFDIVIMGDIGRARALLNMSKIYKGRHIGMKGVTSFRGRKLVATSSEEVLLDMDGEAPGRLPATFEVLPGAIKLKI